MRRWLPALGTVVLVGWVVTAVDLAGVRTVLADVKPAHWWAAAALGPLQVLLSSLRWRVCAERLDVPLGRGRAVGDYGLATLLNQILPGGVAGDAVRVARHRGGGDWGPVVRAAVLERGAGQATLVLVACTGMAAWPLLHQGPRPLGWWLPFAVAAVFTALGFVGPLAHSVRALAGRWGTLGVLSAVILATYLAGFGLCARAVGLELGDGLYTAVPLVFVTLAVPVSIGGWGLRELSSVLVLSSIGLSPEQATAISVAYGASVLVGALPGALGLLVPDGRADPVPPEASFRALGAFAVLNGLLLVPKIVYAPSSFQPVPLPALDDGWTDILLWPLYRTGLDLWRTVGELLLVLLVGVWLGGRRGRWFTALAWLALMVWQINTVAGLFITKEQPLLYDELYLLVHVAVLAGDLWRPERLPLVLEVGVGTVVVLALVSRCWRVLLRAPPTRLALGLLALSLGTTVLSDPAGGRTQVRWLAPRFVQNLQESWTAWSGLRTALFDDSPYSAYDAVVLRERPDVRVVFVESYGRVLEAHPTLRPRWEAALAALDARLPDWSVGSAWTRPPVSGSRSWLSDGTFLMGLELRYEAQYRQALSYLEDAPSLTRWFRRQGYHSVLVSPADRVRPGVKIENDWGFDEHVHQVLLDYRGPPFGWGHVPDQYTLEVTEERWLDRDQPVFSALVTISSHAPWEEIPPLVDSWRDFETLDGERAVEELEPDLELEKQAKRFQRKEEQRSRYAGKLKGLKVEAYWAAVAYELEVLARAIERADDDDVCVIVGDHQPPVVSRHARSFDTPLHVVSRDAALIDAWPGLTPGWRPQGDTLDHASHFSRTVHALAARYGDDPPEVLDAGVRP